MPGICCAPHLCVNKVDEENMFVYQEQFGVLAAFCQELGFHAEKSESVGALSKSVTRSSSLFILVVKFDIKCFKVGFMFL